MRISTIERNDPYTSFNFVVKLIEPETQTKKVLGGFSEVSGLEMNTEFEEYREGGVNTFVHRLPTITKYQNLVLKKGMTDSKTLFNWEREVAQGIINRKSISVILLDSQRREVRKWTFQYAFPIKWTPGNLNSTSSSIEVETLELAHQGLLL